MCEVTALRLEKSFEIFSFKPEDFDGNARNTSLMISALLLDLYSELYVVFGERLSTLELMLLLSERRLEEKNFLFNDNDEDLLPVL